MRPLLLAAATLVLLSPHAPLTAQSPASTVETDPPRDTLHPAHSEILHIPSGGVKINGLAYLAAGAGTHPTFVLLHGLPGNEKNLDLAQAVRRHGWNAITFNYRGSWGSPGVFRFGNVLEDANAVLAYVRDTANAHRLGIDTRRIVLGGHSMGGWATAITASHDHALLGAVLISMADMSRLGKLPRDSVILHMAGDMESLAGVTAQSMADDMIAGAPGWRTLDTAPGLAKLPLLVLTSDDGLAPGADSLVHAARALGNRRITVTHMATDHSYNDKRIALQVTVNKWLQRCASAGVR